VVCVDQGTVLRSRVKSKLPVTTYRELGHTYVIVHASHSAIQN